MSPEKVTLAHAPYRGKTYGTSSATFLPQQGDFLESEIRTAFGVTVRQLRVQAGLSQEQLALAAKLQRKHISALELGNKMPSIATLFRIAYALTLEPAELVNAVSHELQRVKAE